MDYGKVTALFPPAWPQDRGGHNNQVPNKQGTAPGPALE